MGGKEEERIKVFLQNLGLKQENADLDAKFRELESSIQQQVHALESRSCLNRFRG